MPDLDTLKRIVEQASEMPAETREAFVRSNAQGDSALVREALGILGQYETQDQPRGGHTTAASPPGIADPSPLLLRAVGLKIGRYKLRERLGEGGFGVVYLAEQSEPVRRQVALKVIKLGMDSRSVVARFEQERQTLARMEHPNIAKVYDGGVTDEGRPYFVMEYVAGPAITRFCDQERLTLRQRVELFVSVCDAVHHAHMRSVIHRDIKPSNVLVSLVDNRPAPKVIDFGVAKAISREDVQRTAYTERGQIVGSIDYMSPEQAEMSELEVDTRSDIFSLGVLLYELLTGVLPFERGELDSLGLLERARAVRERPRPRPATRIKRLIETAEIGEPKRAQGARDCLKQIAHTHRADPPALARQLQRELEWIPVKAIRPERMERYASAAELARDLQNYLDGKPLLAGPDTLGYWLRKWITRHRPRAAALLVGIAAVVVGLGALLWGYRQQWLARESLQEASAVSGFVFDLLSEPGPWRHGTNVTVAQLLDDGRETIDRRFADQPKARIAIHQTYSRVYFALGRMGDSAEHAETAIADLRKHRPDDRATLLALLVQASRAYTQLGNIDKARAFVAEQKRLLEGHELPAAKMTTLYQDGWSRHDVGDYHAAECVYRQALSLAEGLDDNGDSAATVEENLARLLCEMGYPALAEPLLDRAVNVRRVSQADEPTALGYALACRAYVQLHRGDFAGAIRLLQEARTLYSKGYDPDKPLPILMSMLLQGAIEDGTKLGAEVGSTELIDASLSPEVADLKGLAVQAVYELRNRARLMYWRGQSDDGDALFRRALALDQQRAGASSSTSQAHTVRVWGDMLLAAQRPSEAVAKYEEAAKLEAATEEAISAMTLSGLAAAKLAAGDPKSAESLAGNVVRMRADEFPNSVVHAMALVLHARCLDALGKNQQAFQLASRALDLLTRHLGSEDPRTAECGRLVSTWRNVGN